MKTKRILIVWVIAALSIFGWIKSGWASEGKVNYTVEPFFRYSMVDGDKEKFREDMWIRDRAASGLHEFSFSQNSKGMKVNMEGRAIPDENDYKFDVNLEKEDLFSLAAGFKEFRKYYDGTGGFYSWFTNRPYVELGRDLKLNDGHFFIDFTLNRPDEPNFFINYERHAKSGAISTLRWNSVVENVAGVATTRKIAPSWKELDEVQHTIKFGTEGDAKLFKETHWKLEQKLLYFREQANDEERKYGATAAQNAIDSQNERSKSNSSMTTLLADSRINDWLYISSATQYEHTHASVLEDLTERNATTGTLTNFSANTENFFNSTASSTLDVYSWNGSIFIDPLKYLVTSIQLKAEEKRRNSDSAYPRDTTPMVDFRINNVTNIDTSSHYRTFGESFGVRFTKLPRTVLYLDGEFEQIDGRLKEQSVNWLSAANTFMRDTDISYHRNSITTGINWRPYNFLSFSSQYSKMLNKDNYSDREETKDTATSSFSAFVDQQRFHRDNLTTKVDIKPYKWIHGALKFQLINSKIYTLVENTDRTVSKHDTRIGSASITLIPAQNFYLTGMFSRQNAFTSTVARLAASAVVPTYQANLNTAMGSATYIINPKASLDAQYQLARANNFNDISAFGMPYGIDNIWHRLWMTFKYEVKKDLSTEIVYGFTRYKEKSNGGIDNYEGHIIGGKVAYTF